MSLDKVKTVLRKFMWMATGEVGGRGALFVAHLLLAQRLTVDDFGYFSLVFSIVTFGWITVNFGSGMYGIREVARARRDSAAHMDIISGVTTLRLILFLVFFIVVMLAAEFQLFGIEVNGILVLMTSSIAFRAISLDWYYKGLRHFGVIAISTVIGFSILLFAISLFAGNGLSYVGWSWFVAYFSIFAVYILQFRMGMQGVIVSHKLVSLKKGWETAKNSGYFWLGGVGNNLYQLLPVLYISGLYSTYETGVFSAILRLSTGLVFVMGLMPAFSYSYLSSLYGDARMAEFKSKSLYMALLLAFGGSGVALCVAVWAEEILLYGVGPKYLVGTDALVIMSLYVLLRTLRDTVYVVLSAANAQSFYAKTTLMLPVLWLTLLVICEKYGMDILMASCSALVGAELIALPLLLYYLAKNQAFTVAKHSDGIAG